jgi:hypothetical protein
MTVTSLMTARRAAQDMLLRMARGSSAAGPSPSVSATIGALRRPRGRRQVIKGDVLWCAFPVADKVSMRVECSWFPVGLPPDIAEFTLRISRG